MNYPNTVISMPSQLFTMSRSFKAVANGSVYIGEVDTDPTVPTNQIQVYIEQENGTLVPIAQPIKINSAGLLTHSGQVQKFVLTNTEYSMVVLNSYGAQEHYFPRVYDQGISAALEVEERVLGVGVKIYRGSNGQYVQNGDVVPAGTTHLTIPIGGRSELIKLQKSDSSDDLPVGAITLNMVTRPYSCEIGGETFFMGRPQYSKYDPLFFWAAGDYLLFNGDINPSPTDDTDCVQAAINMTNTNGTVYINAFFYCTDELINQGVLSMKSPMIPTLYKKASQGIPRPYGIANHTTDLFNSDPNNKQVAWQFSGLTFFGNGTDDSSNDATNGMFNNTGKTIIVDYFNLHMDGCDTRRITGIDGSLGSWLWKLTNSDFSGSQIALDLYQPHGAVVQKCGFNFRNKQDLRTSSGTAFAFKNNAMDFDVAYKEKCAEFRLLQGMVAEQNYSEGYNSSGNPLVNGGRGTDVLTLEPGHFVPNSVPVIRNWYFAAGDVERLITLKRDPSEENLYTYSNLWIHDLTINGIGGDVIYHDHTGDPARTLTITRPRIQASQTTEYTIGDPNGTLRFKGPESCSIVDYIVTNPANGSPIDTSSPIYLKNDRNFNQRSNGWQFLTTGTEITLDFNWDRSDEQQFSIDINTTGGGFINKKIYQTGSVGSSTCNITLPYGSGDTVEVKLNKISSYAGAVVDNFNMRATIKGIQR